MAYAMHMLHKATILKHKNWEKKWSLDGGNRQGAEKKNDGGRVKPLGCKMGKKFRERNIREDKQVIEGRENHM